jgi:putative ABC transport system permease protein
VTDLWQDFRYAVRTLLKSPGFAAVAILTLTLGIGANTAIFSVVSSVLLQPLPYENGDRLVRIQQNSTHAMHTGANEDVRISVPELHDYEERNRTLDGVAEYHSLWFTLLDGGEPQRVQSGIVSSNFFELMGIRPILGQTFPDSGASQDAEPLLLLSHAFWQSHFGGDSGVIGRTVEMNDRIHTIIGVLPEKLPQYPGNNDVWMPWYACPFRNSEHWQEGRDMRTVTAFARIAAEATLAQAQDDVERVAREMQAEHSAAYPDSAAFGAALHPLRQELTGDAGPVFIILLGMTGFILLIACANVTNLTLARMSGREQEISVRAALGAGRGRLIRQLITETTLLALAGGALGLLMAYGTLDLFAAFAGRFTPRASEVQVDGWLMLFTLGVSLATGFIVGLASCLMYARNIAGVAHYGSGSSTAGRERQRARNLLVVSQLAVTFVLLVGAGLMLRSLDKLQHVDPGFRPENVLTMQIDLDWTVYSGDAERREFYRSLLERSRNIPGVLSVALASAIPLEGGLPNTAFQIEGRPAPEDGTGPRTDVQSVSQEYFETLRIPLLRGRTFTDFDHDEAVNVAVVNQSVARRYWGDEDPIGTRVSGDGENWVTVVGVVGDVKQEGLREEFPDQVYVPLAQNNPMGVNFLIRTASNPMSVASDARAVVRAIDARQPVAFVRTMEDVRTENIAAPRLVTFLLSLFAALALAISVAGIAGLIAFTVSQRTRELGIRMALGAANGTVLWMVVRHGVGLVLIGLAAGAAGALVLTRFIASWLYDVTPTDPMTFIAIAAVFVSTAALAAYVPARRAARVDPLIALRSE